MLVAGVVILYHPDDDVIQNIQSYLPYVQKLYVADNTEETMSAVASQLKEQNKIQILYDGSNEGIAKRLNKAAALAKEEGFEWLLTMDQDSCFEEAELENYLTCADNYLHKNKTAMFGVEYEVKSDLQVCTVKERVQLITSGSIVNLELFNVMGGFDEALFIDEVDLEYCYRAITMDYKIIQFPNVFLQHHLGNVSYHKSLKNLATTPRVLHSPVRLYYMVRNYLYVQKKYGNQFADNDKLRRGALLNRIKNNLLYGEKRMKTIRFIVKAVIDFNNGKLKKI
ncbi:MAG: glycosyltransferase [Bacteroidota bacterium]|nr:glycosyltransferase [Bacteroidota bacterium]